MRIDKLCPDTGVDRTGVPAVLTVAACHDGIMIRRSRHARPGPRLQDIGQ